MDAQKSRGLELEKGNPIARIKKFVPILVPLIINEVIRSGELAEAMESRGYGISKNPTSLYSLKLVNFDMIVISITMISFVSVILFGY
jgi:energy-coupling factor transport system permease protein